MPEHERPPQLQRPSGTNMPHSRSTDSESTTSFDKHELDEEIERRLGLEEVFADEIDTSKFDLGELLKRWTNAPDADGNGMLSSEPNV